MRFNGEQPNPALVRLEGADNLPVKVRSWALPGSHGAGSHSLDCTRAEEMEAYPVSGGVNSPQNDFADIILPVRER